MFQYLKNVFFYDYDYVSNKSTYGISPSSFYFLNLLDLFKPLLRKMSNNV